MATKDHGELMKVLIVDGFNVLRSGERYAHLLGAEHSLDALNTARETLLTDVATFAQGVYRATVVFDAGGNPLSDGEAQDFAGVGVIFSPAGVSADSVIEELARQAVKRGEQVVVVTSDAQTQWTVLRDKVTRMSAAGFCAEIGTIQAGIAESNTESQTKTTLGERLDDTTREVLQRWVRGKM